MSEQLEHEGIASIEESTVTCVEVYMPKRLAHLSELYNLLRESVQNRNGPIVLDGFTIYEGDGTFWDEDMKDMFEERALIIRLLFPKTYWRKTHWQGKTAQDKTAQDEAVEDEAMQNEAMRVKINELGRVLAEEVAPKQRQIWITGISGYLAIFEGAKADDKP